MTEHFFDHPTAHIHYYKFGRGTRNMLGFHGYGMHGKQFKVLEESMGERYTFYGFDLFFHKQTRLHNQSLQEIRRGISKEELTQLFLDFCTWEQIDRFSLIAYSMGTHYASSLLEVCADRVDEYIAIAPSCLRPEPFLYFLSKNRAANFLLRKLSSSNTGMFRLLDLCKSLGILDNRAREILIREIETPELRLAFYACITYLRHLDLDRAQFIRSINTAAIKTLFIFGSRDRVYPEKIGEKVLPLLQHSRKLVLNEGHELINQQLADALIHYME